ncbi:MAG: multi-sensor hybrid histidine kinase [Haloplasmataceae bacterium]|jgi:signal transduction histidine kinase/ActR/RegA family two-component response regulator|nr:multi-sensor hybrid histidine kinase [Haloplasmataceae bacterium]
MKEDKTKSIFKIIVKNVNIIIIVFFITFILSFFIIEFTTEYQDIKKDLETVNFNNKNHIKEITNNIASFNEIIINSMDYHLIDKNIITDLIKGNPFITNLLILNDQNEILFEHIECPENNDLIEKKIINRITKDQEYQLIKFENQQVYVLYRTGDYYYIYNIDRNQVVDFIELINKDYNFILQTADCEIIFTNIGSSIQINIFELRIDEWINLTTYSKLKIFETEFNLISTIKVSYIIEKLFLNSYLTFIISLIMLIISIILINRKIDHLTNKPYKLFINDLEKLTDLNYNSITVIENHQKHIEYSKILTEFKKICLYNDNEQKKLIEEYEEKLQLAVESNKSKSLFLANMSHEMRTPLNAIIGYTQLSKKVGFEDKDKIKEYFDSINTSSEILLQKINDILDLSKIEAKQFDLHHKPTNLRSLVKELYDLLLIQAELKKLEFTYYIDPQIPKFLDMDGTRLKQVLLNICINAIKFTEKGYVKLEIELFGYTNESIVLDYRVIDSGCGIPKDKIDKIFLPFVQIDNNNSRQVGTGLGLTISQDIIRLMGGVITVTSKENEGSIFTFTTIFKVSELEIHDINTNNEVSNELFEKIIKNKKILIAEDNIINQIFMKEIFSVYKKNDIDFASDGLEAINMVKNKKYDIIFMDIQMPKMSGIEATIHIRKMQFNNNILIIALTANAFSEQISEYLEIGMTDFLPKPIDIQKLKKMVIKYINTIEV